MWITGFSVQREGGGPLLDPRHGAGQPARYRAARGSGGVAALALHVEEELHLPLLGGAYERANGR